MTRNVLVVDLDGTLIYTDLLHESVVGLVKANPAYLLSLLPWLLKGKAYLKHAIAQRVDVDVETLPYNYVLIEWLKEQKAAGHSLVLCTASNNRYAQQIADYLGIFDEVIASDQQRNLAGQNKADVLVERFGEAGFDYAGNSTADLNVWHHAKEAVVVNASQGLTSKASDVCTISKSFTPPTTSAKTWLKVFRVHQWLKNALLFVPLIAAHSLSNMTAVTHLIQAFIAFSLCASSVYITNDLLDLSSDRRHPRKKNRPFASGNVSILLGCILAPALLVSSFVMAWHVTLDFFIWLGVYFVITTAYSFSLKKLVLVDCLALAVLYTLRIIAGAAAATMSLSLWLLAFSIFIFFSLAFVKRYAELHAHQLKSGDMVHGRGYYSKDAIMVQMMGIASAHSALVVLALYLNSDAVTLLYKNPRVVWATLPIMLFWISWVWLKAHRNEMHDDPLVFAVKDKVSLMSAMLFMAVIALGATGWPW